MLFEDLRGAFPCHLADGELVHLFSKKFDVFIDLKEARFISLHVASISTKVFCVDSFDQLLNFLRFASAVLVELIVALLMILLQ